LQILVEIDHYIAAQDQIKGIEHFAENEVMGKEGNAAEKGTLEDCRSGYDVIELSQS
jgi:hypothetical protein